MRLILLVSLALAVAACPAKPPDTVDGGPIEKGVCEGPRPTPLRLLTRAEYNNTVRDILGDETKPANQLPREPVAFGFENNAEVLQLSADGVARALDVAEDIAARAVSERKGRLASCVTYDLACGERTIRALGRRLFRRPLESSEELAFKRLFTDAFSYGQDAGAPGFDLALEWTVAAMLQSPQFLYRPELGQTFKGRVASIPLGSWDLASKLSYFLWESAPDQQLLDAAERGELLQDDGLRRQVERMQADPRAIQGLSTVLRQLLRVDEVGSLEKAAGVYPKWSGEIAGALQTSLERYLEHIAREDGTLKGLLTSPVMYANSSMGEYAIQPTSTFVAMQMPPQERYGLLTQPGLLARLAGPDQSSPIRRGVFVLDRLLCQPPPPPLANANITPPALRPDMTTRERFTQHTADDACRGCHQMIDPVGFTFEGYDGMGLRRAKDADKPVNTSGGIIAARDSSVVGTVDDVRGLAKKLSESRQVHDCMASHLMRYALGRADGEEDKCSLQAAQETFFQSGGQFKALQLSIVMSSSFRTREAPEVAP